MRSCLSRYKLTTETYCPGRATSRPAAGAASGEGAALSAPQQAAGNPNRRPPGRLAAGRYAASQAATKRHAYQVARLRRSLV